MLPSGWKDSRIQDLIIGLESGVSVNGEDRKKAINEKAVLKVSAVSYGYFDPTACKVIIPGELVRAKTNPKAGEIIISRSNTASLVGASAYIDSNYENLYLADKLWQTISKPNTDMKWLSYILASDHPRYTLSKLATGTSGSMKNITKGELLTLKVPTPPFSEQSKIAQILSAWDKAVSTTESLIANSQQQKKSLMQQLLTGKKRFAGFEREYGFKQTKYGLIPNDWQYMKISDVASQYTKKNVADENYPVLSCSKHIGFVDSLKYFNKKVYSDDLTGYKLIPHGYFGFPSNHIEEGSIGCQNLYKVGLVSPIYTIFKPNKVLVNNKFLISILKTEHYRQIFSASTNASVDRRGSLKWKEFSLIKVALPSLEGPIARVEFSGCCCPRSRP